MIEIGDVISHSKMCEFEKRNLQRGMNFRKNGFNNVILMSVRKNAPYADRIEEDGTILIYEGHDIPKNEAPEPKVVDQVLVTKNGTITENGKFFEAAMKHKNLNETAEKINVYEKIKPGIWVFNGVFELIDSWQEQSKYRKVYKFKLRISDESYNVKLNLNTEIEHNRIIPTNVKIEVWKRDLGKCVTCGSTENLHFDHILPFSKGGTSIKSENIQLLCARHNLEKSVKLI